MEMDSNYPDREYPEREEPEQDEFYQKHLRAFPIDAEENEWGGNPCFGSIPELFSAFRRTTGYELCLARSLDSIQTIQPIEVFPIQNDSRPAGFLLLFPAAGQKPLVETSAAISLAQSLAATLAEAYRWSSVLRQREAELAAFGHFPDESAEPEGKTAKRLAAILRRGAEGIGCEAAALYLLDPETTILKLRSLWGLPEERLTDPPRPLSGAMADLEAMLGNAVVLNEAYLRDEWNAPEMFSASVCVPVMSDSTILGTIWFFSDIKHKFSDRDLSAMESASSRIALELERSLLAIENRQIKQQAQRKDQEAQSLRKRLENSSDMGLSWHFTAKLETESPRIAPNEENREKESYPLASAQQTASPALPAQVPVSREADRELNSIPGTGNESSVSESELAESFRFWTARRTHKLGNPLFQPKPQEGGLHFLLPNQETDPEQSAAEKSAESILSPEPLKKTPLKNSSDQLDEQTQQEAEELLTLLKQTVAKRGHCKNITLFVMKQQEES